MKRQDLDKYHNQTIAELTEALKELQKTLQQTHLEMRLNQVKNVHQAKAVRLDIARLKTILHAKSLVEIPSSPSVIPEVKSPRPPTKAATKKKESNL